MTVYNDIQNKIMEQNISKEDTYCWIQRTDDLFIIPLDQLEESHLDNFKAGRIFNDEAEIVVSINSITEECDFNEFYSKEYDGFVLEQQLIDNHKFYDKNISKEKNDKKILLLIKRYYKYNKYQNAHFAYDKLSGIEIKEGGELYE